MKVGKTIVTLALMVALPLTGCAIIRWREARDTDQLLDMAGFRVKPADTPAKWANLNAMPRLKLVERSKDGGVVYTYADPYNCLCLYVGGPEEYATYQRLQQEVVQAQREASIVWELWGP
jgi:hypothetical protein